MARPVWGVGQGCSLRPLAGVSGAALTALLFSFSGQAMQHPPPKLSWPELIILGLLAFGLILGLAANSRSLLDSLSALGFLAFFFFAAWLQQRTVQNARLTTKQGLCIAAAVLLALLILLAVFFWWNF